jgi:hypothetical protein
MMVDLVLVLCALSCRPEASDYCSFEEVLKWSFRAQNARKSGDLE